MFRASAPARAPRARAPRARLPASARASPETRARRDTRAFPRRRKHSLARGFHARARVDARDVSARAVVDDLDDGSLARRLEDAKEEETTTREVESELGAPAAPPEDAGVGENRARLLPGV